MKQMTWITTVLFAVVMMELAGCASRPKLECAYPPNTAGFIYGMGAAQMTNKALAWETATNRARQDLAAEINASVEDMQNDYRKGIGKSVNDDFFLNVSRTLSSAVLSGAEVIKRGTSSGNHYYVMVRYPRVNIKTAASTIIQEEGAKNPDIDVARVLEAMEKAFSWQ
jgi:hypothetical protein